MTVSGFKLPESFVRLIDRPKPLVWWTPKGGNEGWIYRGGEGGVYWVPKGDADSDDWLDGLHLAGDLKTIEWQTNELPVTFHLADYLPEEIAEGDTRHRHLRGWIPFITDFSQIVYFGEAGDGAPYCFDYRDNSDEPSIIHWNDGYWRRMAPSFDSFIGWFDPQVRTLFRCWIESAAPAGLNKPLPEGLEGRSCVRLDRTSVKRMARWSREQPADKPLNLLFVAAHSGLLYLLAIDAKEDMLLLEEHFDDLRREIETE